jgi:hypothetical protein
MGCVFFEVRTEYLNIKTHFGFKTYIGLYMHKVCKKRMFVDCSGGTECPFRYAGLLRYLYLIIQSVPKIKQNTSCMTCSFHGDIV